MFRRATAQPRKGHACVTSVAIRCDDPRCFGAQASVRGFRLFPLRSPYQRDPRVQENNRHIDALYHEFARLLGNDDVLDPDSATTRQVAEVKAKLRQCERIEIELWKEALAKGWL